MRIESIGVGRGRVVGELNPEWIRQIFGISHMPLFRGNVSSWDGNFVRWFLASSLSREMRRIL